jgi:hypothetical protein
MRFVSIAALLACSCLTPRSIMLGQMASPVGKGAAEIGVGAGVGYSQQTAPVVNTMLPNGDVQQNQQSSHGFALPGVEGNVLYGLTERLGFNAHLSSAGVQPGLKITVNSPRDRAHFAFLPEFGVGYASYAQSTFVTGTNGLTMETAPSSVNMFTFMLGLRAIFSHQSGIYAGVGYDLILTRSYATSTIGMGNSVTPTSSTTTTLEHQITVNLGFSVNVGWFRIRPEIAVGIQPSINNSYSTGGTTSGGSGGYGFVILPGFVLAAATPPAKQTEEEEEQKPAEENTNESTE